MPNGETFRLATFNVENLFARYRFRTNFDPVAADGFTINNLAFRVFEEAEKRITAKAIKEVDADVICLQEVESLPVLDRFNSTFLAGRGYRHRLLIDAHDPRAIDVAVLSRFPIRAATSYRHERNAANTAFLFSRDCLDLEIDVPIANGQAKPFRLYVNHFKSMIGGREETRARREEQVGRVAQIVNERWAGLGFRGNFAVLGDFNDYDDEETSLTALLAHANLTDVLRASDLAEADRWTHFFAGGNEYRQLDYLLLATPLYEAAGRPAPAVMRRGMPFRAERYEGPRLEDVGEDRPKASDHAPLSVDIPTAALF